MIQIINANYWMNNKLKDNSKYVLSNFNTYKSFDMYDVNIINLNNSNIWKCSLSSPKSINDSNDLNPIIDSIMTSKSNIIVLFPQNIDFYYYYNRIKDSYDYSTEIKNLLNIVEKVVQENIYGFGFKLKFEPGVTTINNYDYSSDFYFPFLEEYQLFNSNKSNKVNSIKIDNRLIFTCLDIFKNEVDIQNRIENFINLSFYPELFEKPDWIVDINIGNDIQLKEDINSKLNQINKINDEISEIKKILDINDKYKSILYSSGVVLQKEVINILSILFGVSNEFDDKCEEDFHFQFNEVDFIIETKGLNGDVNGKHVMEAIAHKVVFDDQNKDEIESKCIFIVAHNRMKKISDRNQINDRQKQIAECNKCLIIETPILLKIYDDYSLGKIDRDKIFDLFYENNGVLKYS